jgi:hypothetical protein
MDESEEFEEKSHFNFGNGQEFDLVKTIVAFANTKGGVIRLSSFSCEAARLDSARLDDLVNKYVTPRMGGISSGHPEPRICTISVAKSSLAPHVFSRTQTYRDIGGVDRTAWSEGLIPVRRSSKTTAALGDDIQRLIAERLQSLLSALAGSIAKFGTKIADDPLAIPIRITDDPESLELAVRDFNEVYPFTAATVAKEIGKTQNWVANAVRKLGLLGNRTYHARIDGYRSPIQRYSQACIDRIRSEIASNPDFNPFLVDHGAK